MSDPNQPEGQPQPGYQQQPQPGYQQQPQPGYQQQPQPPYGQFNGPKPGNRIGQPAELLDRFLARLIDFILLVVAGAILIGFLIASLLMGGSFGMFGVGGGNFLANLVSSVLMAALYLAYFAYLESSRGQTVGKMVMKLETRGPDGGRPTMEQAIKRNIWVAISILGVIPMIGGFLSGIGQLAAMVLIAVGINGDVQGRRGWHDKFADGTQVIKIG